MTLVPPVATLPPVDETTVVPPVETPVLPPLTLLLVPPVWLGPLPPLLTLPPKLPSAGRVESSVPLHPDPRMTLTREICSSFVRTGTSEIEADRRPPNIPAVTERDR